MKILFSYYQLTKTAKLNSKDLSSFQNGALIKVVIGEHWGVADICPKIELGDQPLEIEIERKGPLFKKALELANADLKARKEKRSLLQNKAVENNLLILNYKLADLNSKNFLKKTIKIKADDQIANLALKLNQIQQDVKIRIDFNSCLTEKMFTHFILSLKGETIKKIEYIEDPTELNSSWEIWNQKIPLAFDFQKADYNPSLAKYQIIKPSRQDVPASTKNVIFTSAMEHPVGLAHALRIAQPFATKVFGYATLDVFEDVGFHQYFIKNENEINFSEQALNDFGIGMTTILNELNWQQHD